MKIQIWDSWSDRNLKGHDGTKDRISGIHWFNGSNAKWKSILTKFNKAHIVSIFLKCFTKSDLDDDSINTLHYEQIYNIGNNSRQNPDSEWQYLEQLIWKNKHIQLPIGPKKEQNNWLVWKELYSSGIVKVKHLVSWEEQFIDLNHYCKSHHITYNFIQTISKYLKSNTSYHIHPHKCHLPFQRKKITLPLLTRCLMSPEFEFCKSSSVEMRSWGMKFMNFVQYIWSKINHFMGNLIANIIEYVCKKELHTC